MMLKVNRAFQCIIPSVCVLCKHLTSPPLKSVKDGKFFHQGEMGLKMKIVKHGAIFSDISSKKCFFFFSQGYPQCFMHESMISVQTSVWYDYMNSHETEIVQHAKCLIHVHKGP